MTLNSDSANSAVSSQEIETQNDPAQDADRNITDSTRENGDKNFAFSIQSILDRDDTTRNTKLSTNKGNSAFHKVKEGRDTNIDKISENMTNCNTGQISPGIVGSPKSPTASYSIKDRSNSQNDSNFKKKVSNFKSALQSEIQNIITNAPVNTFFSFLAPG